MALGEIFKRLFDQPEEVQDPQQQSRLAAAVLLVEIGKADLKLEPAEMQVIRQALIEHFSIQAEDADDLMQQAQQERDASISMQPYIAALTESTDHATRRQLLQALWQVAFADGELDSQEEWLMRRIADLLFLSHADYIQTKLAVCGE